VVVVAVVEVVVSQNKGVEAGEGSDAKRGKERMKGEVSILPATWHTYIHLRATNAAEVLQLRSALLCSVMPCHAMPSQALTLEATISSQSCHRNQ